MDEKELESAVEGILFASGEPIQTDRICLALSLERAEVERILRRLRDYYAFERRGMRLLQLEDKWQLCSSPDHADIIRKAFEIRKPAKLSQPALEALTIIAYYQPTTRAYVDKLRGVDSAYTVGLLLERGLIETCGNLQAPGRPLLYRTTEKFLRSFHISSLDELPPLNEDDAPPQQLKIEDMAKQLTDAPEEAESVSVEMGLESPPPLGEGGATAPGGGSSPPSVALRRHLPPEGGDFGATPQGEEMPGGGETRELMLAEYPRILTARRPQKRKASPRKPKRLAGLFRKRKKRSKKARKRRKTARPLPETRDEIPAPPPPRSRKRKASPRKTKRLAETFRARRKRAGRKARKRRRTARPKRNAPDSVSEIRDAIPAPERRESVSEAATPPEISDKAGSGAARRKLSGKAVRRCFHCLLFGCWLSWPFC